MKILVSGAAGFIGMHCSKMLLDRGDQVFGVDNLNDYYDVSLKESRLNLLTSNKNFKFYRCDIADQATISSIFAQVKPDRVIHLAAQAGVRYSLNNPHSYIDSNIVGFANILEACRHNLVEHLVYASSSSVYGSNAKLPFSESDHIDHPISLYAATKRANELMAHSYSHLYGIPTTGLRFFTVYGPWGRPDMALFLFTKSIFGGLPIEVFNDGQMVRDFTYVDDIAEGVIRTLDKIATPDPKFLNNAPSPEASTAPFRIFNIGCGQRVPLTKYISELERVIGIKAKKDYLPLQPGDVLSTEADTSSLNEWVGYRPTTPVSVGISRFVDWYISYMNPHLKDK
ncbi:MAG: NAD-dependent epimerase [Paracoccaceae bacterium]